MINASKQPRFEVHLSDDADAFRAITKRIQKLVGGMWSEQIDGLDQSYWDLEVGEASITVHREHYLGVCVFGATTKANLEIAARIGEHFNAPVELSPSTT